MIRFKTIDPAEVEKTAPKPAAPAPVVTPEASADEGEGTPAAKGLTRKTPLRAKKPDSARLFRD
ncbi:hypothetical protein [Bosea sp. PAMC 26642]|uniref:hypothetical protein n=1 Tax=Bosea sp. (strain PAMC 26642) TaxID=1792307 RepID=UPI00077063B5|nr:hypothetical protein [Bosea sp. PAMC 26642]AMJ60763.1 hypothetical protein AXW83_11095 [Bosea sp. PAMC 26642]